MPVDFVARTLVGRTAELKVLEGALSAARSGRGSLVAVLGEAGIGKSRLLREVAAGADRDGQAVLGGRAVEAANPVAYRPLAEAMLGAVRTRGTSAVARLGPFAPALAVLVPALRGPSEPIPDPPPVIVAEAVLRYLAGLAGQSRCAVLVLEDLQWADPETLAIVEFLADNCVAERILCLVAVRTAAPSPARSLVRALAARRAATALELGPLPRADVERMCADCLRADEAPPAVVELAVSRSDGLPFLVEELLVELVKGGALERGPAGWTAHPGERPIVPLGFFESIERRVADLDPAGRRAVEAAAVLGQRFDWRLVPALTGDDEDATVGALARGVEAQLLATDEAGFRFRHALTRDAILAALLPPQLARLAAGAFQALSRREDVAAERLAELAQWAGDRDRAATLLISAGRRSLARGALVSAEAALERALGIAVREEERAEAAEALLDVLASEGRADRASEVAATLLPALAAVRASPRRVGAVRFALARAAATAGRWQEAEDQLAAVRTLAVEAGEEVLAARADALAARAALECWRLDEAAALAGRALRVAEERDIVELACDALATLGRRARFLELGEEATEAFERAATLAETRGLGLARLHALIELGTLELFSAHRVSRLGEARVLALETGAIATLAAIERLLGVWHMHDFEPERGLWHARRSTAAARRFRLGLLPRSLLLEAALQAQVGSQGDMEERLAELEGLAGDNRDLLAAVHGLCRGVLALLQERRDDAREELERAMLVTRDLPAMSPYPFPGLWALVAALEGAGPRALADARLEGQMHLLRAALVMNARAVAAGRAGDRDGAERLFARAEAQMAPFRGYRHLARRLVAEGAIEDGWGAPADWLREALAFFEERGHAPIAHACRTLLRRAGAPVPRRGRGLTPVPADLRARGVTSREADVLGLLAEGLSNREIAERLVLSPRTVEGYVSSLIAKLEASGRTHLAALTAGRRAQTP